MIRALIVDDSSFMRKALKYILESDKTIEVVGTASDGEEAIRRVKQLHPDVVLLDVAMPVMDGLTALAHIIAERPVPVVVLSGIKDARIAIKSLEQGAVDFIRKPSGVISYDIDAMKGEIVAKVKTAAAVDVRKLRAPRPPAARPAAAAGRAEGRRLVVIGASTGGPMAVANILSAIPAGLRAAILIVQHMEPDFVPAFIERLRWISPLKIAMADEGDAVLPGRVLVAPGGCSAIVTGPAENAQIRLTRKDSLHWVLPSVDFAMESAAGVFRTDVLGVLLSGMGSDGAKGMMAIRKAGGGTIVQNEASCVVFGMPRAAIALGCVDEILPLDRLAERIMAWIEKGELCQ